MAIINRIGDLGPEMAAWRQHLHTIPELSFDCPKTSAFIKERLEEIGVDAIHDGIAQTGIVAIIEGNGAGPTIGLRADLDALPITEETGVEYASTHPGQMHACGHDGHTAMLLGAATYLAETRNFSGKVALIFQPAEGAGGGGEVMVQEGIMDTFDIGEVYAIHNAPGKDFGKFHTTAGPIMAAADTFHINVSGKGGHGARPYDCVDPVVAACGIVTALQTIVSRNHNTAGSLVISATQIHTGTTDNVIPETAYINGTIRTFDKEVQAMVARRMEEVVAGVAAGYGCEATLEIEYGYSAPWRVALFILGLLGTLGGIFFVYAGLTDMTGRGQVEATIVGTALLILMAPVAWTCRPNLEAAKFSAASLAVLVAEIGGPPVQDPDRTASQ